MMDKVSPRFFVNFVSFINSFLTVFYSVKDISLDIFMILGPATNYVFQAIKFYKTKSSVGFSNFLCLVTMMAHTTKVFFWFGERYVYTLLLQSILVIVIQLYIIYLCVKYQEKPENDSSSALIAKKEISFKEKTKKCLCKFFGCVETFNPKLIWRWDNALEFYKFYFLIIAVLTGLLFACGIQNKIYANIVGYANLILELLSSCPQIIELYRTKNQRNISKLMILLWFSGNVVKIYYNYYNHSPLQLILGAYVQVFFNIILIIQLIYYYRKNKKESKEEKNKMKEEKNEDNNPEEKSEDKQRDTHLSIFTKSESKENEETESSVDKKLLHKENEEKEEVKDSEIDVENSDKSEKDIDNGDD